MSDYKSVINPFKGSLQIIFDATVLKVKGAVATTGDLPLTGNSQNDCYVVQANDRIYTWNSSSSSGLITDWVDIASVSSVDWSAIINKPSSSTANIDDAVSKRHAQGTDQGLDTGGANAVTAAQAKAGYTHSGVITGNPHQVNKTDVGLGNVDNKSEATIITDVKADTDVADALSKKHSHANSVALDLVSGTNTGDQVVPTTLAALSDDSTHRLVTDTEKSTWNGKQAALGFTPEDVSNKDTTTTLGTSDTKYPSQKAVKTYVDALGIGATTIRDFALNIMLNAFRIAQQGSLALLKMINQFVDEYEDETGIDTVNSVNQIYDSSDDCYKNYSAIDVETVLLLHLDNNVTDSALTPKTVTNNNVTFSDTVKKFGTHAAYFNKSNACLSIPDSADFDFGSGDFTIDHYVYFPTGYSGNNVIFGHVKDGNTYTQYGLFGSVFGIYSYSDDGTEWLAFAKSWTPTAETWYHVALVRYGNIWSIYINGTLLVSSSTISGTFVDMTQVAAIGCLDASGAMGGPFNYFGGYIDELRITKGIARWTGNFTPPSTQYPVAGNMTLLSKAQTAEAAPTLARLVLFEEDVDSVTLNTDVKGYVSRDNGATYSQVTLEDCGNYVSGAQILQGVVDISGQPSGTNMKYKVETFNSKKLNLHGAAISWR